MDDHRIQLQRKKNRMTESQNRPPPPHASKNTPKKYEI